MEQNYLDSIIHSISEIHNPEQRTTAQEFVWTFFNMKEDNNKVLLLGSDDNKTIGGDRTLVEDLLGRPITKLLDEEKKYLLHIIREEGRPLKAVISFSSKCQKGLSDNDKYNILMMQTLYVDHQDDEGWKTKAQMRLDDNIVSSIEITEEFAGNFLDNPDSCFLSLAGNGLIKSLEIHTPYKSKDGIYASIKHLYVITRSFHRLTALSGEHFDATGFWKKEYDDRNGLYSYNMVILNNENDYLIDLFCELWNMYKKHFAIKDSEINLLKRVFYLSGAKDYCNIGRPEMSVKIPKDLHINANDFYNDISDAALCFSLLSRIHQDEDERIASYLSKHSRFAHKLANESDGNELLLTIEYPQKIKELKEKLSSIEKDPSEKVFIDRERYLTMIQDFVNAARNFAKVYCPSNIEIIDELDNKYPEYDERFGRIDPGKTQENDKKNSLFESVLGTIDKANIFKANEEFRGIMRTAIEECKQVLEALEHNEVENWTNGLVDMHQQLMNRDSYAPLKKLLSDKINKIMLN